jgi:murein DD-endopeptidase MepM/ murein hydrolase activator NlpD
MNSAHNVGLGIAASSALLAAYFVGDGIEQDNEYQTFDSSAVTSKDSVSLIQGQTATYTKTNPSSPDVVKPSSVPSGDETPPKPKQHIKNIVEEKSQFASSINSVSKNRIDDVDTFIQQAYVQSSVQEVKTGDSFISLAKKAGVSTSDLTEILYQSGISRSVFNLKLNQRVEFIFGKEGLESVSMYGDGITYVQIARPDFVSKFTKERKQLPTTVDNVTQSFTIDSSLFIDGRAAGLTKHETTQIHETLKHKVNFSSLSKGSLVSALYKQESANGKVINSRLLAVRLTSQDKTYSAYFYSHGVESGYYDEFGLSVLPSFRRHPIDDPVITSRYNLNRKHPILKVVRPHWGTDYGHWLGTPIKAISDAEVKFVGTKRGYGNAVILKHPSNIETLSAHMSKFAKGIKRGTKVKKGDVIGYVGKTGLSTGYHLHFELKKDGKRVDSLEVDLPTVDKVSDQNNFHFTQRLYQKQMGS